jgi:hypothetical protein
MLSTQMGGLPGARLRVRKRVAVVTAVAVLAASQMTVPAGATSTPPWLDVLNQMAQVAQSQNSAQSSLQAANTEIENALKECRASSKVSNFCKQAAYVYGIFFASVQFISDVKGLVKSVKTLHDDLSSALANAAQVEQKAWPHVFMYYHQWYNLILETFSTTPGVPKPCVSGAVAAGIDGAQECREAAADFALWWDGSRSSYATVLGPGAGKDLSTASTLASEGFILAEDDLVEVATNASEVLLAARTVEADAKHYAGSKEIQDVLKIIGEKKVAKGMGKIAVAVTGLRSRLEAFRNQMDRCWNIGHLMAGVMTVGSPTYAPPSLSAC